MKLRRRSFIQNALLAGTGIATGLAHGATKTGAVRAKDGDIRAVLLHLGYNMWHDLQTKLNLDEALWDKAIKLMAEKKMNMLVVDVGEGLAFPSRPELAVEGSWSPDKMRAFIANNPKERHGTHRYTLEQFGLDPAQERERYRFYQDYFHVASEGQ